MATTVKLKALLGALEMMMDEWSSYLDKRTGEVHTLSDEAFRHAEEGDDDESSGDCFECCDEDIAQARDILEHDDQYLALPTKFDFNEYRIMEKFSHGHKDDAVSNQLCRAIHGKGAFRYFKDTVYRLGIEKEWFRFRDEAIKRHVIGWCDVNNVKYTED